MRAVVTCAIPFSFPDGNPVSLRIALGNDIAVDTILGWPFIYSVQGVIDAAANTFLARKLSTTFPISLRHPPSTTNPGIPTVPTQTTISHHRTIDNRPSWMSQPLPPLPLPQTPSPPPTSNIPIASPHTAPPTDKATEQRPADELPTIDPNFRQFVSAYHTASGNITAQDFQQAP